MTQFDKQEYRGSGDSFADAARDAVAQAEKQGLITDETELRVIEMSVVASHNPISEYRVVLGPG